MKTGYLPITFVLARDKQLDRIYLSLHTAKALPVRLVPLF